MAAVGEEGDDEANVAPHSKEEEDDGDPHQLLVHLVIGCVHLPVNADAAILCVHGDFLKKKKKDINWTQTNEQTRHTPNRTNKLNTDKLTNRHKKQNWTQTNQQTN